MRTWRSTLRWKLTGAFLFWSAAIQFLTAGVFVIVREIWLIKTIDAQLELVVPVIKKSLEADTNWPPMLEQAVFDAQTSQRTAFFGLHLVVSQGDAPPIATWPPSLTLNTQHRLPEFNPSTAGSTSFETIRVVGLGLRDPSEAARFRGTRLEIQTVEGVRYTALVGNSLAVSDQATTVMLRVLIGGLSVGLIGAGLAGWIVAGNATRRLVTITGAVEDISPSRLKYSVELPVGDDEIGRMGLAVNAMLDRLSSAFRAQEHFISNVSHELKTPIATLLSEAQVLKASPHDTRTSQEFVLSVEEESRKMSSLIETLLALSRASEKHSNRTDTICSLNDIAVEAVLRAQKLAEQRNILITPTAAELGPEEEEPVVRADADLLRIAVDNLIRNAVQMAPGGSRVEVTVGQRDRLGFIEVADRGPGIPAGFIDRMFDRFAQPPNRTVGHRGTGLGLYIARSLAQIYNGELTFADRPGGGATFTLRLPLESGASRIVPAGNARAAS